MLSSQSSAAGVFANGFCTLDFRFDEYLFCKCSLLYGFSLHFNHRLVFLMTKVPNLNPTEKSEIQYLSHPQVAFMFMNASRFDQHEMPTVARTILASFRSAGIHVNSVRSWQESYRVVEHLKNPFHKLVAETYVDTRGKRKFHPSCVRSVKVYGPSYKRTVLPACQLEMFACAR